MQSSQIRKLFFDFFIQHNHTKVASSSLIPAQDPTLLFANAGMNQFKDVFLGVESRSYTRAVSIQKCVRAGGKHNDLDNVGFTKRHLTFFEMMGNFSFGDYFKKEAIQFAWSFLTVALKLDPKNLHASVHHSDDESYDLWHTMIGLPQEKVHRLGDADNFWQMGDIGPCGPCTEIHLDRGASFGCADGTGCSPACDCDRFLEIWNLVFMQYDRQPDGSLVELKHKGVDTGMGFERLAAVMQDKDSVFEVDLFADIIKKTEQLTGKSYAKSDALHKAAFNVLADHVRSSTFLIADGCAPSNDGRGYVLRKIIRRAALFAQKLTDDNIFPALSGVVVEQMGAIYPELVTNKKLIHSVLESEIERFAANLVRGSVLLQKCFDDAKDTKIITGEQAFKLYDTYGFPVELITAKVREYGYTIAMDEYNQYMEEQKERSGKKETDVVGHIAIDVETEFTGYHELKTHSTIAALVYEDSLVDRVPAGKTCFVITHQSPFFIVGGGQVPDHGWLTFGDKKVAISNVRYINKAIAAEVKAPVELNVGDAVVSTVHEQRRIDAMKNHTATHLLQAALMQLFGSQIKQSGSLVHPDYLRFDFTYHTGLSDDDIKKVEDLVNHKIRENIPVTIKHTTLTDALQQGVIAFFGDKYNPEDVRAVLIDKFSAELCGGTHVNRTGDIGTFKIIDVSSPAAGLRRIVALTGPKALAHYQELFGITKELGHEFSVKPEELTTVVRKQKAALQELQKQYAALQRRALHQRIPEWQQEIRIVGDVPTLCLLLDDADIEALREVANTLIAKKPGFYFVGSRADNRASFFARVSPEYAHIVNTKVLGLWLKDEQSLRGGGRPGELQGGGPKFDTYFEDELYAWLERQVA